MPKNTVVCPVCKREVTLTDLGELPKHGGKVQCTGSGYTSKEAVAMLAYAGVRK